MSHHWAVFDAVASERVAALAAQTFDELVKLPNHTSEEVVRDGGKFTVSVWHDVLESGEHRIVVQVAQRMFLGFGSRMHAQGFVVSSKNERRALTEEERSPFS